MSITILTTRIAGNDGVSLECEHWRDILRRMGHKVTFVAGQLDRSGIVIPELHFNSPEVVDIHDRVLYGKESFKNIEADVFRIAGLIEGKLRNIFNGGKKIDLLIIPNVLSLPMHFPLAVALTRVIEELKIPTIARHHDFWWERKRFLKSSLFPFFERWFPPNLPQIKHVVINSIAQEELMNRTGINAEIIWDSFNFDSDLNKMDSYSSKFRTDFEIKKDDLIFLQATRIVPRKRVELSIELLQKLNNPKAILILAGHSGDEAGDYEAKLRRAAKESGIRYKFIGKRVNSKRRIYNKIFNGKTKKTRVYTLWDCYVNADFVTYPTEVEGFGNQFVESIYFKKLIILTPYPVYNADIKPLGFEAIEMGEEVTDNVTQQVNDLITNESKRKESVEKNFGIGKKNFSYKSVEEKLKKLLIK